MNQVTVYAIVTTSAPGTALRSGPPGAAARDGIDLRNTL